MKKKLFVLLAIFALALTGCGKYDENDIVKDLNKSMKSMKSYYLEGKMEIINNEDTYKYDVKVSYSKDDNYRVSLKNLSNNHEQIILKNKEGVYVLTPSLNKSFKFESEWPYNNSQVYLLQSLINDISNDEKRTFEENESGYVFTVEVNYPNNRNLVKQMIYIDKKLNFNAIKVLNSNNNVEITMTIDNIDKKPTFNDDHFSLDRNLNVSIIDGEYKTVSSVSDAIYPMFIPDNTVLTSSNSILKEDGERLILTFGGEKPFVLVEETVSLNSDIEIIPTVGDPILLIDTIGSISEDTVSWISNGVEYYITSSALTNEELLKVAKSISVIPVMK